MKHAWGTRALTADDRNVERLTRKRWGVFLALAAMVVHALIPNGWMPASGEARAQGAQIVICTAMGAKTVMVVDGDGQKSDHSQKSEQQAPCAFAAVAALAPPVSVTFAIILRESDAAATAVAVRQFDAARTTPWQSRAPPAATRLI